MSTRESLRSPGFHAGALPWVRAFLVERDDDGVLLFRSLLRKTPVEVLDVSSANLVVHAGRGWLGAKLRINSSTSSARIVSAVSSVSSSTGQTAQAASSLKTSHKQRGDPMVIA